MATPTSTISVYYSSICTLIKYVYCFVATPTSTICVHYFSTIRVYYSSTICVYYFSTIHVYYFSTICVYYFCTICVYYFSTIRVYYKGVRQFYHHSTKINIVNKLRTISRNLEVFLDEENMLRYRLMGEPSREKTSPPQKLPQVTMMPNSPITP